MSDAVRTSQTHEQAGDRATSPPVPYEPPALTALGSIHLLVADAGFTQPDLLGDPGPGDPG